MRRTAAGGPDVTGEEMSKEYIEQCNGGYYIDGKRMQSARARARRAEHSLHRGIEHTELHTSRRDNVLTCGAEGRNKRYFASEGVSVRRSFRTDLPLRPYNLCISRTPLTLPNNHEAIFTRLHLKSRPRKIHRAITCRGYLWSASA